MSSTERDLILAARNQAQHRSGSPAGGIGPGGSIPGYKFIREIHRGGQGVVYLALQEGTGRKVAVKVMREGPFAGAHDRVRFEREVQVLAQLNNPNIVTIHDSGQHAGCFYYVMDFIAGHTLDDYVRTQELETADVLRLFVTICQAVNAAHLRGVIHRDLKPSNIRVSPEGRAHVLDFGLAKVGGVEGAHSTLPTQMTMTGQFIGSLPWASPEQAEGRSGKIDVRTDVYALGVILYQLLLGGRFPYVIEGPMREVLNNICNVEPARPRSIDPRIKSEVEMIVLKALSKRQEYRYQTAGELARDIERHLAGEPVEAKRDSRRYMLMKMLERHWAPAAGVAAVLLALAIITGVLTVRSRAHLAARDEAVAEAAALRERVATLEAALSELGVDPGAVAAKDADE